jgi:glucose/arabinose dehydrogenase
LVEQGVQIPTIAFLARGSSIGLRATAARLLLACACALALLALPAAARADPLPSGFEQAPVFSGLTNPTSIAFSPDGRVFVAEKSGKIKVFDNLADTTATLFADLTTEVHNFWDRGLLGMALPPNFPTSPYVYVLYTRDAPPGGSTPTWGKAGATGDTCPTPPGATAEGCVVTGRLSRLTVSEGGAGNTMSAETPLITDWCQQFPSHSIGDLAFGADGSLYVSGGEGASFNYVDWGQTGNPCGDPPGLAGESLSGSNAEGGALRSQDVRTAADPTGLNGALLKIDPTSAEGKAGNPFAASLDANARRIVAYGLRNPFRLVVRPDSEEVWVGDVGSGAWEEIDREADPGGAAENFGWPCYEGGNGVSTTQNGFSKAGLDLCESLYAQGAAAVKAPYYAYKHPETVVSGETCPTGSSSITGLAFYDAGPFPNRYDGALFFTDQARDCIWAMLPGLDGLPDPSKIETFDTQAPDGVDLKVGPDGALYYADLDGGKIWRVSHVEGNHAPQAAATADPENGAGPLEVELSAADSTDSDGDTLSYAWDLDEDGEFDDSTLASPTTVYSTPGVHVARVKVSDPDGASDTAEVEIQVDNTPPTAAITAPTASFEWSVGTKVDFSGSASDEQQGSLPASAFEWKIVLEHCPDNCHDHLIETIPDVEGGSFIAPDHEYPAKLRIELTVTDAGGLSDTKTVTIEPKTVTVTVESVPNGLEVGFNQLDEEEEAQATPFTREVIEGSRNTISAADPNEGLPFVSWSDGGDATHTVTVDGPETFIATYLQPPGAPTISGTEPASPSGDDVPRVKGTLGSGTTTEVKLFLSTDCSGTVAATGTAAEFSGAGISLTVPDNATTAISAKAVNAAGDSACSNSIAYTNLPVLPGAPTISGTNPGSPNGSDNPKVKGALAVSGGTALQIALYLSADCSGVPAATGSPAQFAGGGIAIEVPDDSTTAISARASNATGGSLCSNSVSYRNLPPLPGTPTIAGTDPASPNGSDNPRVRGALGSGTATEVRLFRSGDCGGVVVASGSAAEFTGIGIAVVVPDNATTKISARTVNAAGASPCSVAISYVDLPPPPAAPVIVASQPSSPANENRPKIRGTLPGGGAIRVRLFRSTTCSGEIYATGTVAEFTGAGIPVSADDNAVTRISARAVNPGGASACSNSLAYVEDSRPPQTRILVGPPAKLKMRGKPRALARFRLGSSEKLGGFLCSHDRSPYKRCSARAKLKNLKPGSHWLAVKAVDRAGNADPSPATLSFKVVRGG